MPISRENAVRRWREVRAQDENENCKFGKRKKTVSPLFKFHIRQSIQVPKPNSSSPQASKHFLSQPPSFSIFLGGPDLRQNLLERKYVITYTETLCFGRETAKCGMPVSILGTLCFSKHFASFGRTSWLLVWFTLLSQSVPL